MGVAIHKKILEFLETLRRQHKMFFLPECGGKQLRSVNVHQGKCNLNAEPCHHHGHKNFTGHETCHKAKYKPFVLVHLEDKIIREEDL